jgi:signal transduction histidine kinase
LDAEIDCTAEGLGANTSLTVYRVAQEALSNVARHAPGATTRLEVRRAPAHVQVLVRNGRATATPAARLPGPAHGITGMRERVASAGGTVTTGPTDDGGYEVLAVLPAPAPTATAPLPAPPDEKVGA